jgi:serine/threonine protein kinase
LRKKPYTKAVDWWSFGTLVYEMLAGLPPFYDKNRQKMYRKILRLELRKAKGMDSITFDFLSRLLERNPAKRLGSAGGAEEVRSHPFFRGFDWEKVYNKQIQPPFKPKVSDGEDVRNIDKSFLQETAIVTLTPADAVLVDKDAFGGFTFLGVSVLDDMMYKMEEGIPDAMEYEDEEIHEMSQMMPTTTTTPTGTNASANSGTPTETITSSTSVGASPDNKNSPLDSLASSVVNGESSTSNMMQEFAEIVSCEARLPLISAEEKKLPSNQNL